MRCWHSTVAQRLLVVRAREGDEDGKNSRIYALQRGEFCIVLCVGRLTIKSMRSEALRMRTTSMYVLVTAWWFHSIIDAASSIVYRYMIVHNLFARRVAPTHPQSHIKNAGLDKEEQDLLASGAKPVLGKLRSHDRVVLPVSLSLV